MLFLVDRGSLGRQALKEFQAYAAPDDGRKFHELHHVVNLSSNRIDPVSLDQPTIASSWHGTLTLARSQRLTSFDAAYLEQALRRCCRAERNVPKITQERS